MSYTALYRKWRPDRFEDVKGQDAIVTTLKNQILQDRVGHAYLFCGTRGTGKTTVAKIMARAVNCENPVNGSPCGKCSSCIAAADGTSMNIIEIDAASNNGVENIRDIRDDVTYTPTNGKYKVYIIDEAHMLSPGAFNALLKTLEEPPSYVIFILATTEMHRIPVTIVSRCQRYDFKRISVDTIVERLNELMAGEDIDAEEKAVRYIARSADGALRDALSLLDQCNSFYYGQTLTYDKVLEVLGTVDTKVFSDLICAIIARDIKSSVKILDTVVMQGRELTQFVVDLTWYLRNLLIVKTSEEDEIEEVLDMTSENLAQLKLEAEAVDQNRIMRYIRIFSNLSNDIKFATQKRILIEIAIIKLCKPQLETDTDSLADRIRVLEEKFEQGVFVNPDSTEEGDRRQEEAVSVPLPKALSEDIKKAVARWSQITAGVSNPGQSMLRKCKLSVSEDDRLIIAVMDPMNYEYLKGDAVIGEIREAIESVMGKTMDFDVMFSENKSEFMRKYPDLSAIKMDIVTEDQ